MVMVMVMAAWPAMVVAVPTATTVATRQLLPHQSAYGSATNGAQCGAKHCMACRTACHGTYTRAKLLAMVGVVRTAAHQQTPHNNDTQCHTATPRLVLVHLQFLLLEMKRSHMPWAANPTLCAGNVSI